jgi:hypothetical protein
MPQPLLLLPTLTPSGVIISIIVILLILFCLQSLLKNRQASKEFFQAETDRGLISQPPNPDVTARPAPSQPVLGEPAFIASAPGIVPGAAEISQDTTAFVTNTPSPAIQQFSDSVIITSDQANSAYKDILQFLAQNPTKSTPFLEDLRAKFFENDCKYKQTINFKGLAQSQNMVFNS